jgi:AAA domain
MAISLTDLQQTKHNAPPRLLIHGPLKVGKSTLLAGDLIRCQQGAPSPVFIQTEDGLTGIDATAFPLAKSYEDVIQALNTLLNEQHDFKTVVVDSMDWLERLIHKRVCIDNDAETIEHACGGFGKGYLKANIFWIEIISLLDRLRNEKKMFVALICHSRLKTFNPPNLEPYEQWSLKLHSPKSGQGISEILGEWSDIIGFAEHKTFQKIKKSKKNADAIYTTADSGQRVLHLSHSAAYLAGNRYSLPDEIPLDWSALMAAFSTTQQTTTDNEVDK